MASGLLARSRLLIGALLAGVVVGGCGTTAPSAPTVSGKQLTIYVGAPAALVRGDSEAADVVDAEKLAFSQLSHQVSGFTLTLRVLSAEKISDNARTAIEDKTSVAYVGEILPGASADSVGITNAQDLLQVSPTDTAVELTQPTPAIAGSPGRYYEALGTYGRTFARMVPTTRQEAAAVASRMKSLGVSRLYVTDDGSEYGRAAAHAVSADASGQGITISSSASGAGAVFYGASSGAQGSSSWGAATATLDRAAASNPKVRLFVPSGLDDDAFAAALSAGAQHALYVSAPGFPSSALSGPGRSFVKAFRTTYGHSPSVQAIFGYAAMEAILNALRKAGSGAINHTTVLRDFFPVSSQSSVLGTYSIDKGGDIQLRSSSASAAPFVFLRVKSGKLLAP